MRTTTLAVSFLALCHIAHAGIPALLDLPREVSPESEPKWMGLPADNSTLLGLTRSQCKWAQEFGRADTQVSQRQRHNAEIMSYVRERIKAAQAKFTEMTGETAEVPTTSWDALVKALSKIEGRVTAILVTEAKERSKQLAQDMAEGARERSRAADEWWQREQDRNAMREAVRKGIEDARRR